MMTAALFCERVEEDLRRVGDIAAVGRRSTPGQPEQPEQAHYVVDSQAGRVAKVGAQRLAPRLAVELLQSCRVERRQPPVLSGPVELVGRRSDAEATGHGVAPAPRVGAVMVEAHGEVVHEPDLGRDRPELFVEQPLQPLVEAKAPDVVGRATLVAEAVGGPRRQRFAAPVPERVEGGVVQGRRDGQDHDPDRDHARDDQAEPRDVAALVPADRHDEQEQSGQAAHDSQPDHPAPIPITAPVLHRSRPEHAKLSRRPAAPGHASASSA